MASLLDAALRVALGKITPDTQERRNVFWFVVSYLLVGAASVLWAGDLWNGFLVHTGFTMTQIGIIGSVAGIASSVALIAFMGLADRIQHRVRVYVITVLLTILAPVATAGIALIPRVAYPLSALLVTLIVIVICQATIASFPIMLGYPIIARSARMGIRGRVFGFTTTASGVLGIGLGWLSANVLKNVAYPTGYAWCFLAAAAAIALRGAAFSRVRELTDLAVDGASRSAFPLTAIVDVLRLREFQTLAGPHVARGLAMSAAGFALPVGLNHLGLPEHYPGYASAVTTAATVLGGIAVAVWADRLGAGPSCFWGDLLYALGMGTVMVSANPFVFLAIYLVMHFGRNIEDNAIPLGAINVVPAKHLGAFSAARLMVLTASGAVGAPIFGYLFDHYDPGLVFGLAACGKFLTGVWFWYVFRPTTRATTP